MRHESFRLSGITLVLAISLAPTLYAQTENKIALGADFTYRVAQVSTAHDSRGFGITWRIGHSKTGWGWQYGLNWFSTDIDRSIGGQVMELGELRVRPFMGGYGYTRVIGPVALSANLLGGYAITSFYLTPSANDAFRDRLGARSVNTRVANTLVAKPEAEAWIDLGRKIGVKLSAGYMFARPEVTVRSTLGDDKRRIRADMFMVKTGIVYSIF